MIISFKSYDNQLNAIYTTNTNSYFNVSYWGVKGRENTNIDGVDSTYNISANFYDKYSLEFKTNYTRLTSASTVIDDLDSCSYVVNVKHLVGETKFTDFNFEIDVGDVTKLVYHDVINYGQRTHHQSPCKVEIVCRAA